MTSEEPILFLAPQWNRCSDPIARWGCDVCGWVKVGGFICCFNTRDDRYPAYHNVVYCFKWWLRGCLLRVFFGLCTLDELWICNTFFYPLPQWEAGVACSSHLFPSSCGISHLGCLPANYLCHEVRTFPTGSALHMDDPPPRLSTLKRSLNVPHREELYTSSCLWHCRVRQPG